MRLRSHQDQFSIVTSCNNCTFELPRITSYNVCYTKLLRLASDAGVDGAEALKYFESVASATE